MRSLERELASAVARDREARAVDEMKKRAITTAASYDEFKGLVACANLAPLSRQESLLLKPQPRGGGAAGGSRLQAGLFDALGGGGAAAVGGGGDRAAGAAAARLVDAADLRDATTAPAFERTWRRVRGDVERAFAGLEALVARPGLDAIFRLQELDGLLLAQVVACVDAAVATVAAADDATPRAAAAVAVLHQLSWAGRFDMACDMLGAVDRAAVGRVLQARRRQLDLDSHRDAAAASAAERALLDAVARAYGVGPPQ